MNSNVAPFHLPPEERPAFFRRRLAGIKRWPHLYACATPERIREAIALLEALDINETEMGEYVAEALVARDESLKALRAALSPRSPGQEA